MAKYQLIVKGENCGHIRGDCVAIDLDGNSLTEAQKSARLQLIGDKTKWKAEWERRYGILELAISLDPEDAILAHSEHAVLLSGNPQLRKERIIKAWIVEVGEPVDIDALQKEIQQFSDTQQMSLESDPEYQEYLRLERKFR